MSVRLGVVLGLVVWMVGGILPRPATAEEEKPDPIFAFVKERLKDPKKSFTLVVSLRLKDGAEEKFEAAFAKALEATRKEKGCQTYDLNRDSKTSTRYLVYERWKSLADLEAHLKSEHIKALRAVLPNVLDGMPELSVLLPASE